VDVFLASAAPLARDSGCPPNRVNPKIDGAILSNAHLRIEPIPAASIDWIDELPGAV